ncbi:MAG: FTR1 family protein [Gemmatimonadaceae bacterium]
MPGSTAVHQPLEFSTAVEAAARPAASVPRAHHARRWMGRTALLLGTAVVLAAIIWQAIALGGLPDPLVVGSGRDGATARVVEIAILVFREGLESILVLAAVTASFVGASTSMRRPVAAGVAAGLLATIVTWLAAVRILDSLGDNVAALHLQAVTGLLAIVVLLVVMNWFFHKVYWSGWISLHTRRKKALIEQPRRSRAALLWGLALLGFTSFYREGFEVVLFLQSYRLRLGGGPVLDGVLVGAALTAIVALLTFVAHHRLPYKKMLVATGAMLGAVLLVMVGEQVQEMQLAHWLSTTTITPLAHHMPKWLALWFGISPTVEGLAAQALAALLVLGSYGVVQHQLARHRKIAPSRA